MVIFGGIALEQFIDRLSTWPNYINLLYSEKQNLIKHNPKLFAKIEEKYNEIFNKNKPIAAGNENAVKIQGHNQYSSTVINFDNDKKNSILNSIPKMAKIQEGDFFNNYNQLNANKYAYNIPSANNQFMNYNIPSQTGTFKPGQINQSKGKNFV